LPKGRDNVDGDKVEVEQVAGLKPGNAFTLLPDTNITVSQQIYHISDQSGNVATCFFEITFEIAESGEKEDDS